MYLKNDKLIVTIAGDVVMRSYRVGTGSQFLLDETALVGWNDGVDIKRNFTPRQMRSGDFQEIGHHAARYISLTGVAVATSIPELKRMRDDFTSAVPPKSYQPISVQDSVGTRTSTVTLGGKTSWVQKTDTTAIYKLDLYAPDPYLYGAINKITLPGGNVSGGLSTPLDYPMDFGRPTTLQAQFIQNNGNQEAWPTIVVTGDYFSGFSVTDNQGNYITYTGPVSMTSPVTIDTAAGYATQNGSDRSTFLSRRDWFSIPSDTSLQPTFIPVDQVNGWCDIIYQDTWI